MLRKLYDAEHSNWAARLMLGLAVVRDAALRTDAEKEAFDKGFLAMFGSLRECYDTKLAVVQFTLGYTERLAAGKAASVTNGNLSLLEDADVPLNRLFKDFIVKARTAVYHVLAVTEQLGFDFGFFQIKDDAEFEQKAAAFLLKHPIMGLDGIVEMLRGDRKTWSTLLIGVRNMVIHDVDCPKLAINYGITVSGEVRCAFPRVQGLTLPEFLDITWNNLFEFAEDMIAFSLALKFPPMLVLRVTPESKHTGNPPVKYSLAMRTPQMPGGFVVVKQ